MKKGVGPCEIVGKDTCGYVSFRNKRSKMINFLLGFVVGWIIGTLALAAYIASQIDKQIKKL